MRRRLVLLLLPVLALLLLGGATAVLVLISDRTTQSAFTDRSGDAARFAAMTTTALDTGDPTRLVEEIDAYDRLYDAPVWVVGLDSRTLHGSGSPLPTSERFTDALARALAGEEPVRAPVVWPWTTDPMLVLEPIGRDSQVSGVVVIEVDTAGVRAQALRAVGIGVLALLVPVLALAAGLWPLTRWILRPVGALEAVAARVRGGDLDARAEPEQGPPELRGLATSFNAMVDTVQRSIDRQHAFVADAAHQLRNPLAELRLAVENLDDGRSGDTETREAHADAVAAADRMARLFEDMLAATAAIGDRRSAGTAEVEDAAAVLREGEERWAGTLTAAGIALRVRAGEDPVPVRSPPGGLAPVVEECVLNAARLSGASTVRVRLRDLGDQGRGAHADADAPADPPLVAVEVLDDGIGLDEADLGAATGRFWRASRHQNTPGTGLGLTIVTDLVGDVGGRVELVRTEPQGLTVRILMPRADGDGTTL